MLHNVPIIIDIRFVIPALVELQSLMGGCSSCICCALRSAMMLLCGVETARKFNFPPALQQNLRTGLLYIIYN